MSSLNRRYRVQFGLTIDSDVDVIPMLSDPEIGAGFVAPVGSIGLRVDGTVYHKIGTGDNEWENRSLPFPYERYSFSALEVTTTTSATPVTHLSAVIPNVRGGVYEISTSFGYCRNNTTADVVVRLVDSGGINGPTADPTVPIRLQQEMKDSAGVNSRHAGTGTNQALYSSYSFDANLPGGMQTFNLTVNRDGGGAGAGGNVSIFDARITVMRVG